jgi:hypothetical protein
MSLGLHETTCIAFGGRGGGVHYVEHGHPHALITYLLHEYPITHFNTSPLVGEERDALRNTWVASCEARVPQFTNGDLP